MLENIPTYVLAGPLGAGKTSIVRYWLSQRPANERWAVLVNEFGAVGLDAALLSTGQDEIAIAEVAGGCVCCTNGAPFTVALSRLIRQSKPDRVILELSGLSHPKPLLRQLHAPPWAGVLAVQPLTVVLDGAVLNEGGEIPQAIRAVMHDASNIVVNKAEYMADDRRSRAQAGFPSLATWVTRGQLEMPGVSARPSTKVLPARQPMLFKQHSTPETAVDHWSKGWRLSPEQRVDSSRVEAFLNKWPWRRTKAILHTQEGWVSTNLVPGQLLTWRASEWRKDSRLELIFDEPQCDATLNLEWAACILPL